MQWNVTHRIRSLTKWKYQYLKGSRFTCTCCDTDWWQMKGQSLMKFYLHEPSEELSAPRPIFSKCVELFWSWRLGFWWWRWRSLLNMPLQYCITFIQLHPNRLTWSAFNHVDTTLNLPEFSLVEVWWLQKPFDSHPFHTQTIQWAPTSCRWGLCHPGEW